MAVIATWGPSHASLFHALADRGVRRILCEKPMAASVRDAAGMVARAERDGIVIGVHHFVRYGGLAPALRTLAERLELGAPVAVVVDGGAACLVTNGTHWLDFAIELLDAEPVAVCSTATGAPINPRSPTLMIYGGTAVYSFPGGRELTLTLSTGSSAALSTRVYYRNAVAEIDGDLNICLRGRDAAAVARFPAVTRTGAVSVVLASGTLPGVIGYLEGMREALDDVRLGRPRCTGAMGATVVGGCIGALVAARERREVALPMAPDSAWGGEAWPIS